MVSKLMLRLRVSNGYNRLTSDSKLIQLTSNYGKSLSRNFKVSTDVSLPKLNSPVFSAALDY
jgi:hypothetical protein